MNSHKEGGIRRVKKSQAGDEPDVGSWTGFNELAMQSPSPRQPYRSQNFCRRLRQEAPARKSQEKQFWSLISAKYLAVKPALSYQQPPPSVTRYNSQQLITQTLFWK